MSGYNLSHLKQLEAESIHIIREVAAEFENPVMLYSIGKDSSVMLHLAHKAFAPGRIPFPLMHVDTQWKFREMYRFRELMAEHYKVDIKVWINPDGKGRVSPFTHGSEKHTQIMKTDALKQALNHYGFDAAFGGARRDEDGYYWITGRVDDIIIVSGHNLGTAEIESALVLHEAVAEAAETVAEAAAEDAAEATAEAAEAAGVVTCVGFNFLRNPMIRLAKEIVASGEIGDVTGMPLGTVKSHIDRGKRKLQEWLKENDHSISAKPRNDQNRKPNRA